jgi:hypothetical protein
MIAELRTVSLLSSQTAVRYELLNWTRISRDLTDCFTFIGRNCPRFGMIEIKINWPHPEVTYDQTGKYRAAV